MNNPFSKKAHASESSLDDFPSTEEVVDLADIDLDFAVEEAFRQPPPEAPKTPKIIRSIVTVPAEPANLSALELFQGIDEQELAELVPHCQISRVVPGYVLYPVGRFNTRLYVVIEGQMRLYKADGAKRPCGIVDIGQSCGLTSALNMQPVDHSLIATEDTQLLVIEAPTIEKLNARSHRFAQNYAALLTRYTKGDHCLLINSQGSVPAKRDGYIDPNTLLHNQRWLDMMFPRIVERSYQSGKPLSLVFFKVDRMLEIDREAGVVISRYILEALGQLMMEFSRPTDLHAINRHDRLVVVLPESGLDAARTLGNRLREQTKSLKTEDLDLPPVTLSMAIVSLEAGESSQALLERADALIMKSSKAGGNWMFEG